MQLISQQFILHQVHCLISAHLYGQEHMNIDIKKKKKKECNQRPQIRPILIGLLKS